MSDDGDHVIKRYANRKLYDTVRRRFTTLDELAQLLESGVRVVVRDHNTGADRTDEVLAQVVSRQVKNIPGGIDMLTGVLRAPLNVALGVADSVAGPVSTPTPGPTPTPAAPPEPAEAGEEPDSELDRQQAEIRELREQVSQLTQAVTMLLQEKVGDTQKKPAD
ncbi:polyhydroxyalkanoate synthesis regulator DNA-binding domain-containing protein [Mycolicibacterium sp.]|uniref:polyhydroxyalkanoate synthesis regulator DNA-binding domain-containing protein n=1 Tax=Mycolicibacterium sp. TaxID=2320850 RepID=UPI0037CC3064